MRAPSNVNINDTCNAVLSAGDLPLFCRPCWETIRPIIGPTCAVCGIPNTLAAEATDEAKNECHSCRDSPPNYDTATAMFRYEGVLATAIQRMKYRSRTSLIGPLTSLMREHLDTINSVDAVLAVPLHIDRLRKREFNQSLSLAEPVAQHLGVPLLIDSLVRANANNPRAHD